MEAARRGDRDALDRLLRAHLDRVHGLCRRILGNDADAADATQEALLAIARGISRFDGRSALSTWVYRVATNAALDEARRRSRRPVPTDSDADLTAGDDVASGSAQRVDVDRALRRLTPDHRAAVVLRDLCGLDYEEIAEVLGVPGGTVRSRIARGRSALVPLLEGNPSPQPARPRTQP